MGSIASATSEVVKPISQRMAYSQDVMSNPFAARIVQRPNVFKNLDAFDSESINAAGKWMQNQLVFDNVNGVRVADAPQTMIRQATQTAQLASQLSGSFLPQFERNLNQQRARQAQDLRNAYSASESAREKIQNRDIVGLAFEQTMPEKMTDPIRDAFDKLAETIGENRDNMDEFARSAEFAKTAVDTFSNAGKEAQQGLAQTFDELQQARANRAREEARTRAERFGIALERVRGASRLSGGFAETENLIAGRNVADIGGAARRGFFEGFGRAGLAGRSNLDVAGRLGQRLAELEEDRMGGKDTADQQARVIELLKFVADDTSEIARSNQEIARLQNAQKQAEGFLSRVVNNSPAQNRQMRRDIMSFRLATGGQALSRTQQQSALRGMRIQEQLMEASGAPIEQMQMFDEARRRAQRSIAGQRGFGGAFTRNLGGDQAALAEAGANRDQAMRGNEAAREELRKRALGILDEQRNLIVQEFNKSIENLRNAVSLIPERIMVEGNILAEIKFPEQDPLTDKIAKDVASRVEQIARDAVNKRIQPNGRTNNDTQVNIPGRN
jgi:hypothetical protein